MTNTKGTAAVGRLLIVRNEAKAGFDLVNVETGRAVAFVNKSDDYDADAVARVFALSLNLLNVSSEIVTHSELCDDAHVCPDCYELRSRLRGVLK